jgi:sorting nexin-1/2
MSAPLVVTVSDPQKIGDGLNAYMSYKINTQVNEPMVGLDGNHTVVRRFTDFDWLRNQLHELFPYILVASLPEKQQIGRFNQDFIDIRLRALQAWLNRILKSAELYNSDAFKKFLTLPSEAMQSLRDSTRNEKVKGIAEKTKVGTLKFIKNAQNTIVSTINEVRGHGTGATNHAASGITKGKSIEDDAFLQMEAYLAGQSPLINGLYNQAAAMTIRYREQAQLLLDYGASLRALGTTEAGALGASVGAVGLSAWAASTAAYEEAIQETECMVEVLANYVRNGKAIKELMEERSRACIEMNLSLNEVERLRTNINLLAQSMDPKAAQTRAGLEYELKNAIQAATSAREYYDKIAINIVDEVELMQKLMHIEFRAMMVEFVTIQTRNNEKIATAWNRIIPETQNAISQEGGVVPSPTKQSAAAAVAQPFSSSSFAQDSQNGGFSMSESVSSGFSSSVF